MNFRIRTLILLVAVSALGMGAVDGWRRRQDFLRLAATHASAELQALHNSELYDELADLYDQGVHEQDATDTEDAVQFPAAVVSEPSWRADREFLLRRARRVQWLHWVQRHAWVARVEAALARANAAYHAEIQATYRRHALFPWIAPRFSGVEPIYSDDLSILNKVR